MKVMIPRASLGVKRSHGCGHGKAERCLSKSARADLDSAKISWLSHEGGLQGLQRLHARESARSCSDSGVSKDQGDGAVF